MSSDHQSALQYTSVCSTPSESYPLQDTLLEYPLFQLTPSEPRLDSSTSSDSCSFQDTLPEYLLCQLSPSELQSDSSTSSESYIFRDTPPEDPLLQYTPSELGSDRSIPSESCLLQDTLPGYQYQQTQPGYQSDQVTPHRCQLMSTLPGYQKVQDTSSEYQKTTQPRCQLMEYDPTGYKVQPAPSEHKHLTQPGCYLLQNPPSYQVQPAPLEYQEQVALLAYQPDLSASPGLQMKSQQGYQGQPVSSGLKQALPPPLGFLMQPAQPGYIPGWSVPSRHTQGSLQQSQGQNSFKRVQSSGDNHNQDATRPSVALTTVGQYSQKLGAVHRFMLSSPERAAITRECHIMAGQRSSTDNHSELKKARMQRDEKDVQSIVDTIEGMVNPFDNQLEPDKLYHLASGSVAKPLVIKDLDNAKEIGDNAFIDFCKSRLKKGEVEFHEAIKRKKLKTFKDNVKPSVSSVKNKEISLKSDRDTFARCLIVGNIRNISIDVMLTSTLGPRSAALAYPDGSLMKTNKAVLMETLISGVTPSPYVQIPDGSIWVWDAMALVQSMKPQPTFIKFAEAVLRVLLTNARITNSMFVHFVPDQYLENSIKNTERNRRGADEFGEVKIYKPDQSISQWSKYLSSGKNKGNLQNFLFDTWSKVDKSVLGNITLVVGHGNECHKIYVNEQSTEVIVSPVPELYSNQEEADTRILLHCKYINCNVI